MEPAFKTSCFSARGFECPSTSERNETNRNSTTTACNERTETETKPETTGGRDEGGHSAGDLHPGELHHDGAQIAQGRVRERESERAVCSEKEARAGDKGSSCRWDRAYIKYVAEPRTQCEDKPRASQVSGAYRLGKKNQEQRAANLTCSRMPDAPPRAARRQHTHRLQRPAAWYAVVLAGEIVPFFSISIYPALPFAIH